MAKNRRGFRNHNGTITLAPRRGPTRTSSRKKGRLRPIVVQARRRPSFLDITLIESRERRRRRPMITGQTGTRVDDKVDCGDTCSAADEIRAMPMSAE
ncbi:hypothetical protein RB195_004975 [Necator americanus]|uniref:Uncharacterized protein n=1 Tax=Necator americanus TaxID=51031 RepID=A0ABR1BKL2_NECAM